MEQARSILDTNFFGMVRMTRAVVRHMRQRGSGRIINVGPVLGFLPMPYGALYAATKHAVEGYSESLDHEVRTWGIRVSVIEPGWRGREQEDKGSHGRRRPARRRRRRFATAEAWRHEAERDYAFESGRAMGKVVIGVSYDSSHGTETSVARERSASAMRATGEWKVQEIVSGMHSYRTILIDA